MTTSASWILASASPRRRELLSSVGLAFRVHPSRITEPLPLPGESPARYAMRVARLKACEVARSHRRGFVIGADTIVVLGRRVLGKPGSRRDAESMLRGLGGRWHDVVTGICVVDSATGRRRSGFSRTRVHFRNLSTPEREWYLATGEYRDKAGGYAIQGFASLFIDRIEGCYFNVVGFPVATFERLVRSMGLSLRGSLRFRRRKPQAESRVTRTSRGTAGSPGLTG